MTPIDRKRYGRQIRLAEVGEAGQAKLCAGEVALGAQGFAAEIEERYLRAAGVSTKQQGTGNTEQGTGNGERAGCLGLRHQPAIDVAEGALRALLSIRSLLGVG